MPRTSAFLASCRRPRLAVTGVIALTLGVACAAPAAEPKAPAQATPAAAGATTAALPTPPAVMKQVTSPSPAAAPPLASPSLAPKAAAPSPSPVAKATGPTPTPGPAPTQDRVSLPENYEATYQPFYVFDRPDGSYQTPPERSNSCATCHLQATEAKDWVFRANLHFDPNQPQVPQPLGPGEVNNDFYAYAPAKLTVAAGTTITWVNNDVVEHTALALGHPVARRFNPGGCGCVRLLIRSAAPARTIRA